MDARLEVGDEFVAARSIFREKKGNNKVSTHSILPYRFMESSSKEDNAEDNSAWGWEGGKNSPGKGSMPLTGAAVN
ncbi:MAG: hypothetical protein IJB00_07555 [Akkermansia sp.]|nr:hypothetical protein [Akkermansia sp.]